MDPKLIDSCNTDPRCSTTNTKATHIVPKITTTPFIMYLVWLSVRGFLQYGLKKSSNKTADIEFKPVDNELRAALNTPATKSPGKPGKFPKTSITNNGKS